MTADLSPAEILQPSKDPASPVAAPSALRLLQFTILIAVFAVSTLTMFDLDRFFVPKEFMLHLAAFSGGLLLLPALRYSRPSHTDLLLFGYVAVSVLSACFAQNEYLAVRAVAISASSLILFRAGATLDAAGGGARLVNVIALAVVAAAVTSLLQAYGVESELFANTRAPGGTLGNRNFVAHLAAFGLPLLFLAALSVSSAARHLLAASGIAITVATLVLTRSRGGWLGAGAALDVFLLAVILARPLRGSARIWRRLFATLLLTGGAVAAVLVLPNELRWHSDNPYLESIQRVADYQEGSGRGRLIQYQRSLAMALGNPILGVGPGNWPVEYPRHAPRNDPSMDRQAAGMTSNPWPSSDWIAVVSERGVPAMVLLGLAFLAIIRAAVQRILTATDEEDAARAAALLGILAASLTAGAFDAMLSLGLPSLLVWLSLGALSSSVVSPAPVADRLRLPVTVILLVISAAGLYRSASQLVAMQVLASGNSRATLVRAAQIDPGNYRVRLRLARSGRRNDRCAHALAAHELYPAARAAIDASRRCR